MPEQKSSAPAAAEGAPAVGGEYVIDGYSLTVSDAEKLIKDRRIKVKVSKEALARCQKTRDQIELWLQEGAPPIYGINTGLGNLKDVAVPARLHAEWNKKLPYPHAAAYGPYLEEDTARLALLIRANVLCRGYSAVRPQLINRMLSLFNAGISPAVHSQSSTGLSDLALLSQSTMAVAGFEEAKVYYKGGIMKAAQAFDKAGLPATFPLECKEVLSQMNGSSMTQAIALQAYILLKDICSDSIETEPSAGGPSASRRLGCREVMDFTLDILNRENNVSCDNPLLFEEKDGGFQAVMGCNCSNTQAGYCMDLLSQIMPEMAADMIDSSKNQCRNLPQEAAYLLTNLKLMTVQASADSIPTKGGQEDHVEFSYQAANKAYSGAKLMKRLSDLLEQA